MKSYIKKKEYYTLAEIENLKNEGMSKADVEFYTSVYHHYQPLIDCILQAFSGVKLEDGIGIWEAEAIDNYATKQEYARYKAMDEREDWAKLINNDLNKCFCSMGFLDAKGMRFCLPAYMIADIQEIYNHDVADRLVDDFTSTSYIPEYRKAQFQLFNREQKNAVIEYLTYPIAEAECERYGWDDTIDDTVLKAIQNFWKK